MGFVEAHGELWPRNEQSFKALRKDARNPVGVYVLRDGTMPLYIGEGHIASRIKRHHKSGSRGGYWDYFSWYAIPNKKHRKEIESLLLRLLPYYLRSLNKQRGRLPGSHRYGPNKAAPDYVKKPQLAPRKKSKKMPHR